MRSQPHSLLSILLLCDHSGGVTRRDWLYFIFVACRWLKSTKVRLMAHSHSRCWAQLSKWCSLWYSCGLIQSFWRAYWKLLIFMCCMIWIKLFYFCLLSRLGSCALSCRVFLMRFILFDVAPSHNLNHWEKNMRLLTALPDADAGDNRRVTDTLLKCII